MNNVLWISLIGASLVILGLMFLWFMMDILVRITNIRQKRNPEFEESPYDEREINLECKQKTAAASVAVAVALANTSFLAPRQRYSQQMSAWQIGHRYQQLHNQLGATFKDRENK